MYACVILIGYHLYKIVSKNEDNVTNDVDLVEIVVETETPFCKSTAAT